jgi:hypothetical protein
VTEQGAAHERGYNEGKIDQRLAGHDAHFDKINGSIEKTAKNLAELTLAIQRYAGQAEATAATIIATAKAAEATVIATALALKEANEARKDKSDSSWTPVQRFIAVVGGLAVVIGATLGIATYLKG